MIKYIVTSTNLIGGDEKGNINLEASTITGTYDEIKALRDAGVLTPNTRYVITDYQTKYVIPYTNSSGIVKKKTVTSIVSGYGVLNDTYAYDLTGTMYITKLPDGYTGALVVGGTATVTANSSNYYFRFSNNMHNLIGIEFQYFLPRYASLPNDTILNDVNGKPVLKPGGVINTEVHDGTDYMDTLAIDNLAVPTEEIVLFSATKNSFNEEGFSQTFLCDKIWYDINLTAIYDDNGIQISTRKGLITRRANLNDTIDIPKDWRVVKYRRWLVDEPSRLRLLNQDQDPLTSKTAYQSKFLFTSVRRVSTDPTTFYVGLSLEGGFNSLNSGGIRYNAVYTVLTSISAKDKNIFELDSNYNPVKVIRFVADGLDNVVFNSVSAEL
jgi:hypothetical protein